MDGRNGEARAMDLFARLLEYPRDGLARLAGDAEREISGSHPEAAPLLAEFAASLRDMPPARMEEIYTSTFDLQAACCPYIGVHLFGEGHRRRVFLARLNELYDRRKVAVRGGELPDHLTAVLRFLAESEADDDASALREDGLLPALEKMAGAFGEGSANPYGKVVNALRIALRPRDAAAERAPAPGGRV